LSQLDVQALARDFSDVSPIRAAKHSVHVGVTVEAVPGEKQVKYYNLNSCPRLFSGG